jgi:hypothetical protein
VADEALEALVAAALDEVVPICSVSLKSRDEFMHANNDWPSASKLDTELSTRQALFKSDLKELEKLDPLAFKY